MNTASLRAAHREMIRAMVTDDSPRGFSLWWRDEAARGKTPREIAETAWLGLQRSFKVEVKRKKGARQCAATVKTATTRKPLPAVLTRLQTRFSASSACTFQSA